MSMIQIDGQKIKLLREQQGLTQLYLATAVDVTTDTISRWENKRYPSIKKENGLRLADALNVELEEILDTTKQQPVTTPEAKLSPVTEPQNQSKTRPKPWPIVILSATLFAVILAFIIFYFRSVPSPNYTASRTAPHHFISGQPFPVVIELSGQSEKETAFILKEKIPENGKVLQTAPEPSGKGSDQFFLKWIAKIKVPATFSYVMNIETATDSDVILTGTIATAGGKEQAVIGVTEIKAGTHHWADTNADNIISDSEILAVYDKYSGIQGFEDEIDLVEEIWMGDGYRWNVESKHYDIIE
jgi:transcriptional regulator with XRE-family HTH domain